MHSHTNLIMWAPRKAEWCKNNNSNVILLRLRCTQYYLLALTFFQFYFLCALGGYQVQGSWTLTFNDKHCRNETGYYTVTRITLEEKKTPHLSDLCSWTHLDTAGFIYSHNSYKCSSTMWFFSPHSLRSWYETQTNTTFKVWAAALILRSVCTALCLPWVPRSVFS